MRKCASCGSTVGIAATKCWKCGSPLGSESAVIPSRSADRRTRGPLLAGLFLFLAAAFSLLWSVLIFGAFGVFPFGLLEIGASLGFVGGIMALTRVKYGLTIAFVLIPGVFIALRFGLRFGAPFYEVLILSLVFVLLAALLVERNKREFG